MGQYFLPIAPHRRERLSWHGKLGELLFEGSASVLVPLFARPIIPLKTTNDESQSRPAAVQRAAVPPKRRLQSEGACELTDAHRPPRHRVARSRLLELPVEISRLIFDSLDIESAFRLGLTCQRFWEIAKTVIELHFAAYLGVWAGSPVVCVGDESCPGREITYPQGLLRPEDIAELEEGLNPDELDDDQQDAHAGKPVNLFSIADARYAIIKEYRGRFPVDLLSVALDYAHKYPCPKDMLRVANPRCSRYYPAGLEWVLRNLTTKEFVRPTAVALHKKHINGPFIKIIGYGEVILSKICWSTYESTSMGREGVHQGVWAGHALDIVPSTYLDTGGPWEDISDEVAQEIAEIWGGVFGADWRKLISDESRYHR